MAFLGPMEKVTQEEKQPQFQKTSEDPDFLQETQIREGQVYVTARKSEQSSEKSQ